MPESLPPLTAERAFEAAARHMSFARAAEELHVTPAALSFQIKSLEDHLGDKLFVRLNRAVDLTETGRALSPGLTEGFDAIRRAWSQTRRLQDQSTLTVTAGPSFTAKWLSPRLFSFAAQHPDIELRFVASLRMLDFTRDEVDIAIRYSKDAETGLASTPFLEDYLTPMMAPALAATYGTLEGLRRAPLLHDESIDFLRPRVDWAAWCRAAGLARETDQGPRFSHADHALDLAIAGGGVVLGRVPLASGALRDGLLVAPFRTAIQPQARFRIVHQKGAEARPQIQAFVAWLHEEARATEAFRAAHDVVPPSDP